MEKVLQDIQYYKFSAYGFLKNLRIFDAFILLFFLEKGLSYTQIGLLYAIRQIVVNLLEIPSGIFADTYGRKTSLLLSFVVYIASFLILNFATNFLSFGIAFVLYGMAEALRSGTHKSMIKDYLSAKNMSDKMAYYYGHTRSWSQKGSAVSSLISGFVVFYTGSFNNIFIYSILPYLFNLILVASYPQYLNKPKSNKKIQKYTETIKAFLHTIKKPELLKLINTSALHSAYLSSIKDFIQTIMLAISVSLPVLNIEQNKKNGIVIGVLYFFIYLVNSYFSQKASLFENRKNIAQKTLLLGILSGVISGVFMYFDMYYLAFFSFVMIFVIENIRKPLLTSFVAENTNDEVLTSVLSAQSLLKTLMTALLSFAFGLTADYFGLAVALIVLSVILLSLSLLFRIS